MANILKSSWFWLIIIIILIIIAIFVPLIPVVTSETSSSGVVKTTDWKSLYQIILG